MLAVLRTAARLFANEIRWYGLALWFTIKRTYDDLPGPAWLKVSLVIVCLAIPGPQDELILIALVAICRKIRARQAAAAAA